MKREDFPLATADLRLRQKLDQPSRDFDNDEDRRQLAKMVRQEHDQLFDVAAFPYTVAQCCDVHRNMRKNPYMRTLVELALVRGAECVFSHCKKGPCCDELLLSSHVPNEDATVENGYVECRTHRRDRAGRTVAEYLATPATPVPTTGNGQESFIGT